MLMAIRQTHPYRKELDMPIRRQTRQETLADFDAWAR